MFLSLVLKLSCNGISVICCLESFGCMVSSSAAFHKKWCRAQNVIDDVVFVHAYSHMFLPKYPCMMITHCFFSFDH